MPPALWLAVFFLTFPLFDCNRIDGLDFAFGNYVVESGEEFAKRLDYFSVPGGITRLTFSLAKSVSNEQTASERVRAIAAR